MFEQCSRNIEDGKIMQLKPIVMYLPQFYQTPENDLWWGEGFTDWVATKKARKYEEEQDQPRVPLNNNYYCLLDKDVMQWQAKLASEYDIYGFAFYHYWFKDGRKILEKPAENLLEWKDINMKFCFSWANETWARSWTKLVSSNFWNVIEEKQGKQDEDGILLLQEYGDVNSWRQHFEYLEPFFKDERYIKKDNKPIFLIHFPQNFIELGEMTEYWNVWAKEAGLGGVYFIVVNPDKFDTRCDARAMIEPSYSFRYLQPQHISKIPSYSYDDTWEIILSQKKDENIVTYPGGFVDYDDTPRRGEQGGIYCRGTTPEKFEQYFSRLVDKCRSIGSEFIFLNAWNEWGEGMYLEPDMKNGYGYLQAIRNVMEDYIGNDTGNKEKYDQTYLIIPQDVGEQKEKKYVRELARAEAKYNIMNKWYSLAEKDLLLADYLEICGYKEVAIYGLGVMGKHLISDLNKASLRILYGIDQKADKKTFDFSVYTLKNDLPRADVIVVALANNCDEVIKNIQNKTDIPAISLEVLLCRAYEYYIK